MLVASCSRARTGPRWQPDCSWCSADVRIHLGCREQRRRLSRGSRACCLPRRAGVAPRAHGPPRRRHRRYRHPPDAEGKRPVLSYQRWGLGGGRGLATRPAGGPSVRPLAALALAWRSVRRDRRVGRARSQRRPDATRWNSSRATPTVAARHGDQTLRSAAPSHPIRGVRLAGLPAADARHAGPAGRRRAPPVLPGLHRARLGRLRLRRDPVLEMGVRRDRPGHARAGRAGDRRVGPQSGRRRAAQGGS